MTTLGYEAWPNVMLSCLCFLSACLVVCLDVLPCVCVCVRMSMFVCNRQCSTISQLHGLFCLTEGELKDI